MSISIHKNLGRSLTASEKRHIKTMLKADKSEMLMRNKRFILQDITGRKGAYLVTIDPMNGQRSSKIVIDVVRHAT